MPEWDVTSVLSSLAIRFQSEGNNINVRGFASLSDATEGDLAFCWYTGERGVSSISKSKGGVILCKKEMQGLVNPRGNQLLIFTDNPRLAFVRVANEMRGEELLTGISRTAIISEKSKIGSNCYIGDYVVVGDNCSVGDNTIICDRVSLVKNCIIGNNCVVQSGAS